VQHCCLERSLGGTVKKIHNQNGMMSYGMFKNGILSVGSYLRCYQGKCTGYWSEAVYCSNGGLLHSVSFNKQELREHVQWLGCMC
jgi:hypothetical protein